MLSNIVNSNQFQNFQANPEFEVVEEEEDDQQFQQQNQDFQQYQYSQDQDLDQNQQQYYQENDQSLQSQQAHQLMGDQLYQTRQQDELVEYVNCPQHPQNKVTTICRNPKCNEPLCSQCVVQHKLYHQELLTQPNIQSITQVRAEALEKLDMLLKLYQKQGNLRNNDDQNTNGQNSLYILKEAKSQVMQMVEDYFKELEKGIEGSRGLQDQNEFEHYQNLKSELEGEYYMQALLEILENYEEFQQHSELLQQQNYNDFEDTYSGKYIGVNQAKIFQMRKELGDFVFLKDKNEKVQVNDIQKIKEKKKIFSDLENLAEQSIHQATINDKMLKTQHQQTKLLQEQNKNTLVQTMPIHKINNKLPIFQTDKQQTSQQASLQASKHHQTQTQNQNQNNNQQQQPEQHQEILPISYQNNNNNSNKKQQQQSAVSIIPNHQQRLQKLSNIDERMARLQNQLQRKQFQEGDYLLNTSSLGNNNSQLIEEQNQEILNRISNKYQIPLSQNQNKLLTHIDVEVVGPEAFSMNQNLVYFQENTKKMYIVDCSKSNIQLNDVTLKADDPLFKIPQHHRSINTPNDGIFLIGGIYNNSNQNASDLVYKVEQGENQLQQVQRMNYDRASPGVCFANKAIYVCGGFSKHDESSSIDTFEKFDLQTNKWVSLRHCHFKASSCALATFEDKYIFKFGGKTDLFNLVDKIEYYDIENDEWFVVHVPEKISRNIKIASELGAIQINSTNILFYGGNIHSAKCNKAYILQINENSDGKIDDNKFIIQPVNDMALAAPITCQPLLRDGEVLSFLDVANMADLNVSYYNRKTVGMFNGTSWKTL